MIKLAIVEDNLIYMTALETYMNKLSDIHLVHIASNLHSLPALISAKPDVVIMDIDLGPESGIKGVQVIKEALPGTGILMLTVFDDEEKVVQSIQAGAAGYLLKKDTPKKIIEAVRDIYSGGASINSQVALTLINAFPKSTTYTPDFNKYNLTKRETEILLLLIEGLSYKQIASNSFISMATLNTHIRNIYDKLDLHSRAEIAAKFRG